MQLLRPQHWKDYELIDSGDYEKLERWLPTDIYIGGAEHAVLHLLYARFWHKFLYDIGVVPTSEPFQKLYNQGMILGETIRCGYVKTVRNVHGTVRRSYRLE